jgi:hypothetical protein
MEILSRPSAGHRLFVLGCATNRRKGAHVCANDLIMPMRDAEEAVLSMVEDTLLNPAVVARARAYAEAALATDRSVDQIVALEDDLSGTEAAIRRLTAAIATGGDLAPLVEALKTYDDRRRDIEARLTVIRTPRPTSDPVASVSNLKAISLTGAACCARTSSRDSRCFGG